MFWPLDASRICINFSARNVTTVHLVHVHLQTWGDDPICLNDKIQEMLDREADSIDHHPPTVGSNKSRFFLQVMITKMTKWFVFRE